MIQEIGRTSRISKSKQREEGKHKAGKARCEAVGSWQAVALSRVWGLGWDPKLSRSAADCLADLGQVPAPPLPLFKEPELSFINICQGSAYRQESNVELAPYSSPCLKFVGAISSSQGWCAGLVVLRAASGDTKRHHAWSMTMQAIFHNSR